MILKEISEIMKEDLHALVDADRQEGQMLDYKQTLPKSKDSIIEFLKDVSALANSAGGDIIFGIVEEQDANGQNTGKPHEINGLENINVDQEKLTLLNHIADKIQPKVFVTIHHVDGFEKGPVLIVRVRKSWRPPHMILPNKNPRFYTRDNNGNRPLDIEQIRNAFLQSENLEEKILNLRDNRLARIVSGETPVPLTNNPSKLIVHMIPLESLNPSFQIDLNNISKLSSDIISPINSSGYNNRYNYLGYLTSFPGNGSDDTYLQVLRNGVIEAVSARTIWAERKKIEILSVQNIIITHIKKYLKILENIQIQPPFVIFISIINVKGFELFVQSGAICDVDDPKIDCNDLLLPDVLVENIEDDIVKKLIPTFDVIWQAGGWEKSLNWDAGEQTLAHW